MTCFYVRELHSYTNISTTVTNDCFKRKAFSAITFSVGSNRSFASKSLRNRSLSFGGSYLSIRFDAHLSKQNGVESYFSIGIIVSKISALHICVEYL
jgi:hypothetical protein